MPPTLESFNPILFGHADELPNEKVTGCGRDYRALHSLKLEGCKDGK
jgi:hypothetical protein